MHGYNLQNILEGNNLLLQGYNIMVTRRGVINWLHVAEGTTEVRGVCITNSVTAFTHTTTLT